ncbi:MAG: hypothetical protein JKY95_01855 [Planctomycetaceae bacterium]|nr:hypothetical protein [Planctomycetaceae bacterium]
MNQIPSTTNSSVTCNPTKREHQIVWILLAVLAGLLLARLAYSQPLRSANDRSRWCTVWSLVENGSYQIDEITTHPGWDTIDKVRHEEHFYSTKPPLYPTMLAGMYWGINKTTGLTLLEDTKTVTRTILLLVNIIPYLIAMYCLWGILVSAMFTSKTRLILLGIAGSATMLTPFLTVLNNHTVGATSLIIALYAAVKIFEASKDQVSSQTRSVTGKNGMFVLAGFFAAFTCCNELPAALFGLGIFLILLRYDFKRTWLFFVPAALIPLVGFFVTNYLATGGWKPFYMYYGTEKYVYEHLGIPSYWADPRGVDKARDSVPVYMFHCLVGHHGVFSLSPILLLMIPGYFIGLRNKSSVLRVVHFLGIFLTVAIFAFYWKRTENYNYGGVSVALRWVLWLTPFWLLAIAEVVNVLRARRWLPVLLILLIVPSLYSAWGPWQSPWQQPWIFNTMTRQGWIDYSDPPKQFAQPLNTWFNKLPDSPQSDDEYWIEFTDGKSVVLRMEDAGPIEFEQIPARSITVKHFDAAGKVVRVQSLTLDVQKFAAGKSPKEILLAWSDDAPQATRKDQLKFLHGLPGTRDYREGRTRYLFHSMRENAFRCQLAATRIVYTDTKREFRCDLWLCKELPFGTYKKLTTITAPKDKSNSSKKTLSLARTGKLLE